MKVEITETSETTVISKLKETLLAYSLVIENEWLEKYLELIKQNLNTKPEKYTTNKHHTIPAFYYTKKYNISKNDDKVRNLSRSYANLDLNNLIVYMSICDHILAHYFLGKCLINNDFKRTSLNACLLMINRLDSNNDFNAIITDINSELINLKTNNKKIKNKKIVNTDLLYKVYNKEEADEILML